MGWREEYQQGSFRGVAFRTEQHQRSGGRRVVSHEFPGRDEPVTEDLGRRAREFRVDCHIVGADYRAGRDALIDALEAAGPGLLVHPWHGRMMVNALDYSSSESTEEGGICRIAITFAEAGLPASSPVAQATGQDAPALADRVMASAAPAFATDFSVDGAAGFVEEAAAEIVNGMAQIATVAAGLRGGVGPTLRAFEAGLRFLPANMQGLLRAPLNLGFAITGLVASVAAISAGTGPRQSRLASLQMMLDWQPSQPVFPVRTPQRQREAANRTALLHLFRSACAAELTRAASQVDFSSYDDASATRDAITQRFDVLALAAADRGDDAAADIYDDLRRALARDIAARGASLARVYALRLAATEPALVVAHRLYGGITSSAASRSQSGVVSLEARAAGIVARNRVAHPGFIPAGIELEMLTGDPMEQAA